MNQALAGNEGGFARSQALEQTLSRARMAASDYAHNVVTLEHFLYSLIDDPDADDIMAACNVNVARLKNAAIEYLIHRLADLRTDSKAEPKLSSELDLLLKKTSGAAREAGFGQLDGAMLLVGLLGESSSVAAQMLADHNMTFDEAVRHMRFVDSSSSARFAGALRPPGVIARGEGQETVSGTFAGSAGPEVGMQPGSHAGAHGGLRAGPGNRVIIPENRETKKKGGLSSRDLPPPVTIPDLTRRPNPSGTPYPGGGVGSGQAADVSVDDLLGSVKEIIGEQPAGGTSNFPAARPAGVGGPRHGMQPFPEGVSTHPAGQPLPPRRSAHPPYAPVPAPVVAPRGQPVQPVPAGVSAPAQHPIPGGGHPGQRGAPAGAPLNAPGQGPSIMPGAAPGTGHGHPSVAGGYSVPDDVPPLPGSVQIENERRFGKKTSQATESLARRTEEVQVEESDEEPSVATDYIDDDLAESEVFVREEDFETGVSASRSGGAGGSRLEAALAKGALAENIPRKMRSFIARDVEVRIAKADVMDLDKGMVGGAVTHEVAVTEAMTVQLRAPQGGFIIESGAPETQWIGGLPGHTATPYGRWRWTVTPTTRGRKRLQLVLSARTVDHTGLVAETPMPEQIIVVDVKINYARSLRRLAGWVVAAIAGGALTHYAEEILRWVETFLLA